MQKTNRRYRHFEQYVLRNPLFSFSFYKELTKNAIINFTEFKEVWKNEIIKEALFLASPTLYTEIEKCFNHEITDPIKTAKIQLSFFKYLSRMASRCTPFGLFAGCSVGNFGIESNIKITNYSDFNRQTRFDMNFLVALSLQLANKPEIKKQLLFYPNSSIYKAGKHLRYVEYKYLKNHRIHNLEAVSNTDYLNVILESAKTGKRLTELVALLVNDEITNNEATNFIEELVENQLLVSELEPSVSGSDFLEQVILILEKLKNTTKITKALKNLATKVTNLDNNIGNKTSVYFDLVSEIKKLETTFELKYLFQTDLFTKTKNNTLNTNTVNAVKKGMVLLNKMTAPYKVTNLSQFRKAFVKRYEQEEVPLTLALDIEMGIGYLQQSFAADDNPILDDLQLPINNKEQKTLSWTKTQDLLHKKILQNKDNYILELTENDFKNFEEDWNDLPDTISTLAEIILIDGKEMVYFDSVGGSSAGNLLGRFCSGSESLLKHTQTIIAKETELQNNKILAEIVHLPQARTGNILIRPKFRTYEIPYLAKSNVALEHQIAIDDLMLSVKGDEIILRSKKHNKEVIPHLTNAHNYSNGLPIYHFLCDLQTQNLRSSLYFSWRNATLNQSFLPRVVYNNVIFHKASWIIKKEEITPFLKLNNTNELLDAIKKWRSKLKMPQYVQFIEGDNTLLINLNNITSVKMLMQSIKKREEFILEEFLFADDGVVKSESGYYTNQVVFPFYKGL